MIFADHVKAYFNALYKSFPREMGIPARRHIGNFSQFMRLAEYYHLDSPIFIQLYDISFPLNNIYLDKLWTDFDGHNQYLLLDEVRQLYERYCDFGFQKRDLIIEFTGKKGYHVYAKIKSENVQFERNGDEDEKYNSKDMLLNVLSYFCQDLKTPDWPLFGDSNRIVRVPGIQRPERSIAFVLNPDELFAYDSINEYIIENKYNWGEMVERGTKYLNVVNGGAQHTITELYEEVKETGFKIVKSSLHNSRRTSYQDPLNRKNQPSGVYSEFLKKLLKNDALWYAIHAPNPMNHTRVAFGIRLLKAGLPVDFCVEICSTLDWWDFKDYKTRYYLEQINQKIKNGEYK